MSFNTHHTTPDMGTREAINAMLCAVAWDQNMGYRAPVVYEANYRALWAEYSSILATVRVDYTSTLQLIPHITGDGASGALGGLVEQLIGLCNDYPCADDEVYHEVEHERLVEAVGEILNASAPIPRPESNGGGQYTAEEIAYELEDGPYGCERGDCTGCVSHESDGGVFIHKDCWTAVVGKLAGDAA